MKHKASGGVPGALCVGAEPVISSNTNNIPEQGKGQVRSRFSWPKLRKAIEFYEKEGLCYLPAGWGRKNPSVKWEPFQTRLPTMAEKADWFHEGRATNIGVLCGGVSGGLVILAFNDQDGAREFFGQERWQGLLASTFVTRSVRGYHVWLPPRSDTPIKSCFAKKDKEESWLEIRADGNFTVAPPSLHPSSALYQAVGVDSIYKPKDLAGFIDKRLSELGLTARVVPEGKPKRAEEAKKWPQRSDEFNTLAIEKLLEHCAYLYTASLTTPMGHDWTQIYLYIANKAYSQWRQKESGAEMPDDIRVESINDEQMRDLNRLKAWLYQRRTTARQDKDRAERRQKKEDEAQRKKEAQPALFTF